MKEKIYGVHSSEIKEYLSKLGLSTELEAGNLKCSCCEETISVDNFGAMTRIENMYFFACAKEACRLNLATLSKGKQRCS